MPIQLLSSNLMTMSPFSMTKSSLLMTGNELESLCKTDGDMPAWFRTGMEAALLAPTALTTWYCEIPF